MNVHRGMSIRATSAVGSSQSSVEAAPCSRALPSWSPCGCYIWPEISREPKGRPGAARCPSEMLRGPEMAVLTRHWGWGAWGRASLTRTFLGSRRLYPLTPVGPGPEGRL